MEAWEFLNYWGRPGCAYGSAYISDVLKDFTSAGRRKEDNLQYELPNANGWLPWLGLPAALHLVSRGHSASFFAN